MYLFFYGRIILIISVQRKTNEHTKLHTRRYTLNTLSVATGETTGERPLQGGTMFKEIKLERQRNQIRDIIEKLKENVTAQLDAGYYGNADTLTQVIVALNSVYEEMGGK